MPDLNLAREDPGQRETVSYAFLLLLQKLGPVERAVFVLRDAGGKVSASSIPIRGGRRIAKFIFAVRDKGCKKSDYALRLNNTFGVLSYTSDAPYALQLFEFGANAVQGSYVIRNPDKLKAFSDGKRCCAQA